MGRETAPLFFCKTLLNQTQLIGSVKSALIFEKGLVPKNPRLALNGLGCAVSTTAEKYLLNCWALLPINKPTEP